MIDQKTLLSLVHYDPETGVMIWRSKKEISGMEEAWNRAHSGKQLTSISQDGYLETCIVLDGIQKDYRLHRLAWLYVYGEFPKGPLDHINRIKIDNRISNLRLTSIALNGHNVKSYSTNKSGVKGVSWCKLSRKWRAVLVFKKKYLHLGLFSDIEDAKDAYASASALYAKEFSIHTNVANHRGPP